MGGVEALLKLLRNGLDGDAVRSIMQASVGSSAMQCAEDCMFPDCTQPLLRNGLVADAVRSIMQASAFVLGESAAQGMQYRTTGG
jgi:hypothetical protein